MLEELQHLQKQITYLVNHVTHLREKSTNSELDHAHKQQQLEMELKLTQEELRSYKTDINQSTQELGEQKSAYQQLAEEHLALSDKYNRLDNSCSELRKRFEALLQQKNQLINDNEQLNQRNTELNRQISDLSHTRDQLLKKNEQAKLKVEAIIHRLNMLGTEQDGHMQEIQQLSHLNNDH